MDKLLFDALCAQKSAPGTYDAALEGKKLAAGCARSADPDQGTSTDIAPKWFQGETYTLPFQHWGMYAKLGAVALAVGAGAVLYFHLRPQRVILARE